MSRLAPTLFVLLLLLLSAGCSNNIFTANSKGVSRAGFEREVARRLAVTKASNPKELEGSRGRKLKASTEREVATEMIKRALVEDQAAKLSVAVSAAAVKARVEADRAKAGADTFISGTCLFHRRNLKSAVARLRKLAEAAVQPRP